MASYKISLCQYILNDFHGDFLSKLGVCLLKNGACDFGYLVSNMREHRSGYACHSKSKNILSKVQKALQILIRHGMVTFHIDDCGVIKYKIHIDTILYRMQYVKVLVCARFLYGDAAEMLVELLLHEGRVTTGHLLDAVTKQLNQALVAQGADEVQPSFLLEKFERLVSARFIRRSHVAVRDDKGEVISLQPPPSMLIYVVPHADDQGAMGLHGGDGQKEMVSEQIWWEVNFQRFQIHFRNQMLVSATASYLDSEKAGEVMRTILRHTERSNELTDQRTVPIDFHEIHAQMSRDQAMSRELLDQWLKTISTDMPDFLQMTDSAGGGHYCVNLVGALQALCIAQVESAVMERFGSASLRLFKVLMDKQQVDESWISSGVLLPAKEVKEMLFNMYREHFVHLTELSKSSYGVARNNIYLWTVDIYKVIRLVLQHTFKGLQNIMQKRQLIEEENRRLLDKHERLEILATSIRTSVELKLDCRVGDDDGGVDPETQMEVDNLKQDLADLYKTAITPSEEEQFNRVKSMIRHLLCSELQLESSIFLMETYLQFTYQCPVRRRKQSFLQL